MDNLLKEKMDKLEQNMSQMNVKMDAVLFALMGNDISPGGVVAKVATLEERVKKLEESTLVLKVYQKIVWLCVGGAIVWLVKLGFEAIK